MRKSLEQQKDSVGEEDVVMVGAFVGEIVGDLVGFFVGALVGLLVGALVGLLVGAFVGLLVGAFVMGGTTRKRWLSMPRHSHC